MSSATRSTSAPSRRTPVTEELISNNPHRAWDWDRLSATLPLSIIAANEPDLRTGMWNWNWRMSVETRT